MSELSSSHCLVSPGGGGREWRNGVYKKLIPQIAAPLLVNQHTVDGQVRLQRDNFFFLSTNGQMKNFRVHDEQTVNRIRKIALASVSLLKWQQIYIYISGSIFRVCV